MHYSFDNKRKNYQNKLFTTKSFDSLTEQQRKFAQTNFKKIYAQEMSKLAAELIHQRKIKQNLQKLDEICQISIKETQMRLNKKFQHSDRKRNQNKEKKLSIYKMNDQRWHRKMQQIEQKFKDKNRKAVQKANLYRQQSQSYWNDKKRRIESSKLRANPNKNQQQRRKTIFQRRIHSIVTSLPKVKSQTLNRQASRTLLVSTISHKNLNKEIRIHRQKMEKLKEKQEATIFQKVIQKLEKIEKTRKNKKLSSKILEPTIPKKSIQRSFQNKRIRQNGSALHDSRTYTMKHKQSSINDLLRSHQFVKQQKQHQQFINRGVVMQKASLKNKKNKIIRLIREKVLNIKLQNLKIQI